METTVASIVIQATFNPSYISVWDWWDTDESLSLKLKLNPETFDIEGYRWVVEVDRSTCPTYEEVATDFELGVSVEVPDGLPDSAFVYQRP